MVDQWQQGIQALLSTSRVSFLATQGEFGPESSMAPYAIHYGLILLHLSALAKHVSNIEKNPKIGLMICTPESEVGSPLSLPRLSLQGELLPVTEMLFEVSKAAYLSVIPDAEPLFSFADFKLFQCAPASVNWVGGFGKARKLTLQQWHQISAAGK